MTTHRLFQPTFAALKKILQPYAARLSIKADTAQNYYLDAGYSAKWKREIFFGAVTIKKNYVSFYLMPVYMFPDLLKDISPGLKKHMQGKSCFNFKAPDEKLFAELAALTEKSIARVRQEKLQSA